MLQSIFTHIPLQCNEKSNLNIGDNDIQDLQFLQIWEFFTIIAIPVLIWEDKE